MPYPNKDYGIKGNPLKESVFVQIDSSGTNNIPPVVSVFVFLNGNDFLLLNGNNLETVG